MNRKLLAAMLALVLILSAVTAAFATSVTDNSTFVKESDSDDYHRDPPSQGKEDDRDEHIETMTMYVVTDNGKGLNVRSEPYVTNYNIIGVAPYGSRIDVLRFLDNGWAAINWNYYGEAYVQSRFLQWYMPYNPPVTPTPTPYAPTPSPYDPAYSDTIAGINAEFRTMRTVTPFTISVRPVRSSGWVNMRWAPGKDMEVIKIYYNNDRLTVISEGANWYQVEDPNTGSVGYMMKTYTVRIY